MSTPKPLELHAHLPAKYKPGCDLVRSLVSRSWARRGRSFDSAPAPAQIDGFNRWSVAFLAHPRNASQDQVFAHQAAVRDAAETGDLVGKLPQLAKDAVKSYDAVFTPGGIGNIQRMEAANPLMADAAWAKIAPPTSFSLDMGRGVIEIPMIDESGEAVLAAGLPTQIPRVTLADRPERRELHYWFIEHGTNFISEAKLASGGIGAALLEKTALQRIQVAVLAALMTGSGVFSSVLEVGHLNDEAAGVIGGESPTAVATVVRKLIRLAASIGNSSKGALMPNRFIVGAELMEFLTHLHNPTGGETVSGAEYLLRQLANYGIKEIVQVHGLDFADKSRAIASYADGDGASYGVQVLTTATPMMIPYSLGLESNVLLAQPYAGPLARSKMALASATFSMS